jgi:hypothetical protein
MTSPLRTGPPNLPVAPDKYSTLYQNTYSNILRLFFTSLTNSVNSPSPYGSFYDSTTQTNPVASAVNTVAIGNTSISISTSLQGGNRIYITQTGIYNLQFISQLQKGGAGVSTAAFWLMQNGFNITNSAKYLTLSGGVNSQYIISWNWMVQLREGDYVQLVWSSADTSITLPTVAAAGSIPASPSVDFTVAWVSAPTI